MTTFQGIRAGQGFFSLSLGGSFNRQIRQAKRSLASIGDVGSSLSSLGGTFTGLGAKLTGLSAGMAAIFGHGVGLAASAEQAEVSFRTLLGSAEEAKELMASLKDFAASTPFQVDEIRQAARMLAAFGVEGDQIVPTLTQLGDVSAGTGNRIAEIAELFGKAKVQGRLFGEDINQLTGRGIPIIGELAKILGVTESEVKGLVAKGEVGFPQLAQAFRNMTAEGSTFGGMMGELSVTAGGTLSTLKDNLNAVSEEIGRAFLPVVTELSGELIRVLQPLGRWIAQNRELVFQLGMFVPKGLAVGAAFIGIGTAMSTAGSVITAVAATIGASLAALAGPAGPILLVTAAIAGMAAAMPEVRATFVSGLEDMESTAKFTAGAVAAAFQDGSLTDAITIATAGMQVAWQTGLNNLKIAQLEFNQWLASNAAQLADQAAGAAQKALDVGGGAGIIKVRGNVGGAVQELQQRIEGLENRNTQQQEALARLPQILADKRAEERTAKAVEELVRMNSLGGTGGLLVTP